MYLVNTYEYVSYWYANAQFICIRCQERIKLMYIRPTQWWIFKIGGLRQNSNKGPQKINVAINDCN